MKQSLFPRPLAAYVGISPPLNRKGFLYRTPHLCEAKMTRKSFTPIPKIDVITERRFKAMINAGDPAECWKWTGATAKGYGRFKIGKSVYLAHRVAYRLHCDGLMPPGLVVMHTCDNPSCCNPAHLKLGTYAENVADMDSKDRRQQARGEACTYAKLTAEAVMSIRSSPLSDRSLARLHGVSKSNVHLIRSGQSWRHV